MFLLTFTYNLLFVNNFLGPFDCGKGVFCDAHCILERFKCDGVPDCKNGKDEFVTFCGNNKLNLNNDPLLLLGLMKDCFYV